ncbi:hypothetical protein CN300_02195 [Bacillus thuringiensis]|uniref:hypothetical protein n=1 Tax=Bacillus thuringiensis TaxID=1428 RepID=UPI000BF89A9F|nr:hypothetical protein [Bacillus thuringiensis]PFC49690.1 hypothetical protein CN300_02195 [Bacillus thuringiensis]
MTRDIIIDTWFIVRTMVCIDPELKKELAIPRFLQDIKTAQDYWKVSIVPPVVYIKTLPTMSFTENDFVDANELNSPQADKVNQLFQLLEGHSKNFYGDSKPIVHIYYMNINFVGSNSNVIGRCYTCHNGNIHIVISNQQNINTFSHELGHGFFYSNLTLKGNDPISGEPHNKDKNNLMYYASYNDKLMNLEQAQIDATKQSYLINPNIYKKSYHLYIPNQSVDTNL